jgi:predicted GNAT family N-acyltransferase
LLQPQEENAALDLWVEVFPGTDREQWKREFDWDLYRFERTQAAVTPNGTLLATMRYLVRHIRDAHGRARRTGWLTNVVTKPTVRSQGHARQLLERTIAAMRHEDCEWALLTADDTASGFYARCGWRAFPLQYRQGALSNDRVAVSHEYWVRPFDPSSEPAGWEALATIYQSYNSARPLTVVRDQEYWLSYGRMRFTEWCTNANGTVFVAERADHALAGYVLAHLSEMGFLVTELCVQPNDANALLVLLQAVIDEVMKRGFPSQGRVHLPHEAVIDAALQGIFGATLHQGYDSVIMAYGLADSMTNSEIDAIFAAPGAICWPIDDY